MEIIISNSSDKPIYEQIAMQIKSLIMNGTLSAGEALPSMRTDRRFCAGMEASPFAHPAPGSATLPGPPVSRRSCADSHQPESRRAIADRRLASRTPASLAAHRR